MSKDLGTAAQVAAELKVKADAAAANKAAANVKNESSEKEPERTKKAEPKVKVTDLIITLIKGATYLEDGPKAELLADIDKMLNKATNAKPSIKNEVRELLFNAPVTGISRDTIFSTLSEKHPEMSPMTLAIALYGILQPVLFKKGGSLGWDVKTIEGGNYVWNKSI